MVDSWNTAQLNEAVNNGSLSQGGGGSDIEFKILSVTKAYEAEANGVVSFNLYSEITVPEGYEIVGIIGFDTQSVYVNASTVTVNNNSYGVILNNLADEAINNSFIATVLCVTSGTITT